MSEWQQVCALENLNEGEPFGVEHGDKRIALFLIGNKVYATGDVCPHQFALLSTGYIDGDSVVCPLHGAEFDIKTGRCQNALYKRIQTYDAEVRDGAVFVDLAGRIKA
ncbi:MAG: nitrite reductase small subunit NirD [Bradyrhizobium sp.]